MVKPRSHAWIQYQVLGQQTNHVILSPVLHPGPEDLPATGKLLVTHSERGQIYKMSI
jgi:hypothetical protein